MSKIINFFHHVFSDKKWLAALALINFIGFLYGVYFYQNQLAATPMHLWIFVLDSPIAVLFIALFCTLRLWKRKNNNFLAVLAVFGLIKYGLWTIIVLLMNWQYFYAASPLITSLNLPLHAAMVLEGIALLAVIKPRIVFVAAATAFFLLNDYLDYFYGTATRVPTGIEFLVIEAFASTIIIATLLLIKNYMARKRT